jgi:hypothetical protein
MRSISAGAGCGFDVLRFDERRVAQEPVRIVRQVRKAIGAAS